jgi:hypothetical protein
MNDGNSGGHYDRGRDVLSSVMRFFEQEGAKFAILFLRDPHLRSA